MAEHRQTSKNHRHREEAERTREEVEEAIRDTAVQSTHAGEQVARQSIDLLQTNAHLIRHTTDIWLTLMTQMAEHNAEYIRLFGSSSRRAGYLAQQSSRDLSQQSSRATRDASGTVSNALRDMSNGSTLGEMSKEWINFIQRRTQQNVDHWASLINCRTPQDVMAAQTALFRENFEELVENWRRITEGSMRLREQVGREISQNLERSSSAA
jgi:phasin family protein